MRMTSRLETSPTVLLVNDHDDLREATRDLLTALGCQVTAVSGVGKALKALDGGATWDLVVCDVPWPRPGGAERIHDLCAHRGTRGVVLTSNGAAAPALRRCLGKGGARLLRKPFSAAELRAALEEALARGARMPAVAATRRPRPRSRVWSLAAATVLAVVASAALRLSEPGPPPLPEPVAGTVRRGTAIELGAPLGDVAGVPAELVWRPAAGAVSYRIRVLGVDDRLWWEAKATGGRIALPPEVRERLRPGVVTYWQVEALDGEAAVTARSERALFRVLPNG